MNRIVCAFLALGLAASVGADPTAKVFGLNLFALPVEVAWGDQWTSPALGPRVASTLAVVPAGLPQEVKFRRVGVPTWSLAKGPDGTSLKPTLDADGVYVLVVRVNGTGELVKVDAPAGPAPKVLFVNAARTNSGQFRLGTAASADNMAPGFTAFVDAKPGKQTLTWSWPEMPPGTDFYKADSPQPGRPGVIDLQPGRWYVAVIASVNSLVSDITP